MAYDKQTWVRGEKVASTKLNHMEDGISSISANGAIDTANLAPAAVTNDKLDQEAVDSNNIRTGGIITENLADGAVTTPKIAGGAVTTAKIADGAVTDAKLAQSGGVLSEVADLKSAIDKLNGGSFNLLNPADFKEGKYLVVGGGLSDNANSTASGFFPVSGNTTYYF